MHDTRMSAPPVFAPPVFAPPVFIVIVDEILVATDLQMIITDLRPDARVITARTLAEAAQGLDTPGRIEVAFIQHGGPALWSSALALRVARDGGLVVLLGEEPHETPAGTLGLPFPFQQTDVAQILDHAARSKKASGCDAGGQG